MPAISKHDLHKLMDALPERDTLAAKRLLEYLLSKAGDPCSGFSFMRRKMMNPWMRNTQRTSKKR